AGQHRILVYDPDHAVARIGGPADPRGLIVLGKGPSLSAKTLDYLGPEGESLYPVPLAVAPSHFSLQLASSESRDSAFDSLVRLDRALFVASSPLRPHVIEREGMWVVMLGDFPDAGAAKAALPEAKTFLGQGGIVRDMGEFCPIANALGSARGFSACAEGGFRGLRSSALLQVDDPHDPEPEPWSFPPVTTPPGSSAPFVHPPASEILVITASRAMRVEPNIPSQTGVKFETLIWRPKDPLAPGPITEEEVVRVPGIVYSDGK
ncbi:MAG: SPOR domain-containing protein, partial [Myxococcales bacterium]|nr:SPOR domain-containing protein [Myxococcales bacterium]